MKNDLFMPDAGLAAGLVLKGRVGAVYRLLLICSATLIALSFAGQMAVHLAPDFLGRDFFALNFDVDHERSVPTLFSVLLHLCACVSAFLVGWTLRQSMRPFATMWLLVALLFMLTMVDEHVSAHERLMEPLSSRFEDRSGVFYFSWVIVGLPLAGLLAMAFLRPVLALPRDIRRLVILSAALFLGGAVGVEMLGGGYIAAGSHWRAAGMEPFLHVEEGLEMFGLSTFIYAMLRYRVEFFGPVELRLGS